MSTFTFTGTYTTWRDGRIAYSYQATVEPARTGYVWTAQVFRGQRPAGQPHGQVSAATEKVVRVQIEAAIEARIDVE